MATWRTAERCPPLFDNRRGYNESEGVFFYTIALDDGPFMNPNDGIFGIGIVGLDPENPDPIDFDENGAPDIFTACQFSEGFGFVIWGRTPYSGKPVWEAYYYLGYEVEGTDCPTTRGGRSIGSDGCTAAWASSTHNYNRERRSAS